MWGLVVLCVDLVFVGFLEEMGSLHRGHYRGREAEQRDFQGPWQNPAEQSLPQEDSAQTGSYCEGRQQAVKLVRLSQIEET